MYPHYLTELLTNWNYESNFANFKDSYILKLIHYLPKPPAAFLKSNTTSGRVVGDGDDNANRTYEGVWTQKQWRRRSGKEKRPSGGTEMGRGERKNRNGKRLRGREWKGVISAWLIQTTEKIRWWICFGVSDDRVSSLALRVSKRKKGFRRLVF